MHSGFIAIDLKNEQKGGLMRHHEGPVQAALWGKRYRVLSRRNRGGESGENESGENESGERGREREKEREGGVRGRFGSTCALASYAAVSAIGFPGSPVRGV